MKVCVVRNTKIKTFFDTILPSLNNIDLVLFSYQITPNISYENEITGKENLIETFVTLSKKLNAVVVVASKFDLFSKKSSSILLAENGMLLGIADSIFECPKNEVKEIKLFTTNLGKIGIIVNQDIVLPTVNVELKKFGAELLLHICDFEDIKELNIIVSKIKKDTELNIFSLNPNCFLFTENNEKNVQSDFCDFFTKEIKI